MTELKKENQVLVPNVKVADSFVPRLMGLMGRDHLPSDEALVFPRCNSIHTWFMRVPIDVVFVSEAGKVVETLVNLSPWRMLLPRRGAKHAIELRQFRSQELGISVGDTLECKGVWS